METGDRYEREFSVISPTSYFTIIMELYK